MRLALYTGQQQVLYFTLPLQLMQSAWLHPTLCRVRGGCRYLKPPSGARLHDVMNLSSRPISLGVSSDTTCHSK